MKLTDKNYHANHHEEGELQLPSDRSFAWVMTGACLVFGLLPVVAWNGAPQMILLAIGGVFLGLGLVAPSVLHPLNIIWMRFAGLLHMIVSPIVLGGLFFLVFTPMGLVIRLFGTDLLRLKYEQAERSYWIERTPPGPPPESMKNQF